MAFCTAANICGPLWAPKLFWVCRRAQGGSRPKLGCDPSPIAQCSLALGGISPGSWAYQCTCICACSVTKYMPCITPKIYFGHLIAVGIRCAIVVVAKPLFLISSQLISCGTPNRSSYFLACGQGFAKNQSPHKKSFDAEPESTLPLDGIPHSPRGRGAPDFLLFGVYSM